MDTASASNYYNLVFVAVAVAAADAGDKDAEDAEYGRGMAGLAVMYSLLLASTGVDLRCRRSEDVGVAAITVEVRYTGQTKTRRRYWQSWW